MESTTTPALDAALAAYSLSRDDLPGIADAWQARYAELETPFPDTEIDVLARLIPRTRALDEISFWVIARSDGTFDVLVEGDDTNSGDLHRETVNLSGEQARELLAARERGDEISRLHSLQREAERYADGSTPIWWLLSPRSGALGRYADAVRAWNADTRSVERLAQHLAQIDQLRTALDTEVPISDVDAKKFPQASGYAVGVKPLTMSSGWNANDKAVVRVDIVNRIARDLAEHTPQLHRLQEAIDAAHALPAGALREYLIGERETKVYRTVEGTGRKKRAVVNSYTPTSDLVKDHAAIVRKHARAVESRDEQSETLRALRAEAAEALARGEAALESSGAAVASLWGEGWPSAGTAPAPGRPIAQGNTSFLPVGR